MPIVNFAAQFNVFDRRPLWAACGIEVNGIANRLTSVHRSLRPALYTLVRRGRAIDDSPG